MANLWLPPVNIPSFSGGPDYSANLYQGLSGIGDTFVTNRNARTQQSQFAQGLALDQQRLAQAQTIADRNYALDQQKYALGLAKMNQPTEQWRPLTAEELSSYHIDPNSPQASQLQISSKNNQLRSFGGGGTTVKVNTVGTIPPGYRLINNPDGSQQMEVIPGSPPDLENRSAEQVKLNKLTNQAQQAETMLYATSNIKKEMENANTPATGTLSRPFAWYSGSPAGRVRSYVAGLKSGIVFEGMIKLKNASSTGATGFGQMNLSELQTLIDQVGSLNPDNTEPDIFLATIDRIERQWNAVVNDIRVNVSPEELAKLGLENVFGPNAGAAPAGQKDGSGNTWESVN